jgi:hypothetical protein
MAPSLSATEKSVGNMISQPGTRQVVVEGTSSFLNHLLFLYITNRLKYSSTQAITSLHSSRHPKNAENIKNVLLRNPLPIADAKRPTNRGILPQPEVTTALQSWTTAKGSRIL